MKTILYKAFIIILILSPGRATYAQFDLLYLGVADNPLDIALQEYLGLEGYNVTFVSATDFGGAEFATADGYEAYDALFVSESIGSSSANNYGTAGFPIPCVMTEGFALKQGRLDILADDSETHHIQYHSDVLNADALTLVITDNEHWITQEFELDDQLLWAQTDDATHVGITTFNLADDIPGARPLGKFLFDTSPMYSFWAIPQGSMLHESVELPNMAFIGAIQSVIDPPLTFTGDFHELLVRCIRWVTDDYENQVESITQKYKLTVSPNPTTGPVNISLTLPGAGKVRVNIYDIAGRHIESVDAGYRSGGDNSFQLNISDLPEAQYIFEIITRTDILKGKIVRK